HREQIEKGDELALIQARRTLPLELAQVSAQHLVDQIARQLDVAVAEERDEIVLTRPLQRVLEIDDHLLARRQDHDVAALVVAVREPARRRGTLLRYSRERGPQLA